MSLLQAPRRVFSQIQEQPEGTSGRVFACCPGSRSPTRLRSPASSSSAGRLCELRLIDLEEARTRKAFGLDARIAASRQYATTQCWSRAFHDWYSEVDGMALGNGADSECLRTDDLFVILTEQVMLRLDQ